LIWPIARTAVKCSQVWMSTICSNPSSRRSAPALPQFSRTLRLAPLPAAQTGLVCSRPFWHHLRRAPGPSGGPLAATRGVPEAEPLVMSSGAQRRLRAKPLVILGAVLALAVLCAEAGRVAFGGNFHTIVPGRVYRCAQPSGADLERFAAEHGIRTV